MLRNDKGHCISEDHIPLWLFHLLISPSLIIPLALILLMAVRVKHRPRGLVREEAIILIVERAL